MTRKWSHASALLLLCVRSLLQCTYTRTHSRKCTRALTVSPVRSQRAEMCTFLYKFANAWSQPSPTLTATLIYYPKPYPNVSTLIGLCRILSETRSMYRALTVEHFVLVATVRTCYMFIGRKKGTEEGRQGGKMWNVLFISVGSFELVFFLQSVVPTGVCTPKQL